MEVKEMIGEGEGGDEGGGGVIWATEGDQVAEV